jgi:hypothetical protein
MIRIECAVEWIEFVLDWIELGVFKINWIESVMKHIELDALWSEFNWMCRGMFRIGCLVEWSEEDLLWNKLIDSENNHFSQYCL